MTSKKWIRISAGVLWMFLLMGLAFPAVIGERADTAWLIISAIASLTTALAAEFVSAKRKKRRRKTPGG